MQKPPFPDLAVAKEQVSSMKQRMTISGAYVCLLVGSGMHTVSLDSLARRNEAKDGRSDTLRYKCSGMQQQHHSLALLTPYHALLHRHAMASSTTTLARTPRRQ